MVACHPVGIGGSHLALAIGKEAAEGLTVQAAATVAAAPEAVLIMEGREAIVVMMGGAAGAVAEGTTTL